MVWSRRTSQNSIFIQNLLSYNLPSCKCDGPLLREDWNIGKYVSKVPEFPWKLDSIMLFRMPIMPCGAKSTNQRRTNELVCMHCLELLLWLQWQHSTKCIPTRSFAYIQLNLTNLTLHLTLQHRVPIWWEFLFIKLEFPLLAGSSKVRIPAHKERPKLGPTS